MLVMENGVTKTALGSGVWTSGNIQATGNILPNNQAVYGLRANDGYFDTINTGSAGDPLEINYRTAGPVKVCATASCATYSAYFDANSRTYLGNTTTGDQTLNVSGNIHVYNGATSRGYLYQDGTGFGLLNSAGNWIHYTPDGSVNEFHAGNLQRTAHSNGFFVGSYNNVGSNDAKSNPIYTIGSSYQPTDTTLSNMYGIGYSHSNFWGGGKSTGWGLYTSEAGVIHNTISDSGMWSSGSINAAGGLYDVSRRVAISRAEGVNYVDYARSVYTTQGWATTFNWSGQGGQPTWLWGSNDGLNMYVWNPSNFSVSGSDMLDGLHYTSFSRKDADAQWLRDYYQYGSYLTTEAPSTLRDQMGGGGLRVDFMHPSYTGTGDWAHVITFSGYQYYGMTQLAARYGGTQAALYVRKENNSGDNTWSAWRPLLSKVVTTVTCQGGNANCTPPPCPSGTTADLGVSCPANYSCIRQCCWGND